MKAATIDRRALVAGGTGVGLLAAASAGVAHASASPGPRILPAQRQWRLPPPLTAREGLASLPGVELYYWDTGGDGAPIVLLHPVTGSAMVWGYQQAALAATGHRVIAYSRRGHARSQAGAEPASAVDDLAALMDSLKVARFHMVGCAAGGFIVPDFALSYPDRLLSMTIACSQGGIVEPAYRARIEQVTGPAGNAPASFRELGPSYRAGYPEGVAAWEALEHAALSGSSRVAQRPKNRLSWEAVSQIHVPALVIAGAADLLAPAPLVLEFASHLPAAQTAILSESGHSGYWEQPDAFNAAVLACVESAAGKAPRPSGPGASGPISAHGAKPHMIAPQGRRP